MLRAEDSKIQQVIVDRYLSLIFDGIQWNCCAGTLKKKESKKPKKTFYKDTYISQENEIT